MMVMLRGRAVWSLPEPVWVWVLLSIILLTLAGGAIFVVAALLRVSTPMLLGGAVAGLEMAGPFDASGDTGSSGRTEAGVGTLSSESGISRGAGAAVPVFLRVAARFLVVFAAGGGGVFVAGGDVIALADPSSGEIGRCSGIGLGASCLIHHVSTFRHEAASGQDCDNALAGTKALSSARRV